MDHNKATELVLYRSRDGAIQLEAQLERETIWLDAHQMSELFGRDRTVILRHLRNVYTTGGLDREATCAKIAQVATDGKTRQMKKGKGSADEFKEMMFLVFQRLENEKGAGSVC